MIFYDTDDFKTTSFIRPVLQDIARLTVEFLTDGFQSRKAYRFGFSCFQDGKVSRCKVNPLITSRFTIIGIMIQFSFSFRFLSYFLPTHSTSRYNA